MEDPFAPSEEIEKEAPNADPFSLFRKICV